MAKKLGEAAEEQRLTYEIPEAGALLGLSKSASYVAANRGEFGEIIRIGKRMMVLKASFRRKFDLPAA